MVCSEENWKGERGQKLFLVIMASSAGHFVCSSTMLFLFLPIDGDKAPLSDRSRQFERKWPYNKTHPVLGVTLSEILLVCFVPLSLQIKPPLYYKFLKTSNKWLTEGIYLYANNLTIS